MVCLEANPVGAGRSLLRPGTRALHRVQAQALNRGEATLPMGWKTCGRELLLLLLSLLLGFLLCSLFLQLCFITALKKKKKKLLLAPRSSFLIAYCLSHSFLSPELIFEQRRR